MAWKPKDILERLAESSPNESSHELYCRCLDAADEVSRLRAAIQQTLDENGHLADGEVCTLIVLKRAIGMVPNVGGEARLAAHQLSQTTTATPQGVASTDQLGRVSEARN